MAVQLKGGAATDDPRLDRVRHFDPRSVENFHIRTLLTPVMKPRSQTYRVPVGLNQGQEGACVGNGWGHWIVASPHWNKWVTEPDAKYIYHEAQKVDPWPGGEYAGAVPTYSGTSVLAGAQVLSKLGCFTEYRWATSIDDVILALGHTGPVVLGIDWYDSMYNPDSNGYIHVAGSKVGGHCLLAHGITIATKSIKLWNSWDWHECQISYEDLNKLLLAGGEACIPINKAKVIPEWPKAMIGG